MSPCPRSSRESNAHSDAPLSARRPETGQEDAVGADRHFPYFLSASISPCCFTLIPCPVSVPMLNQARHMNAPFAPRQTEATQVLGFPRLLVHLSYPHRIRGVRADRARVYR